MGSYLFVSPKGRSKVHAYVFERIVDREHFEWVDKEFLHRFSKELYEDYFWIAGEDRQYFADRIRSILAAEPGLEGTNIGGGHGWNNEEGLGVRTSSAANDRRLPGLLSVAEHLEESDSTPVVITYSVTARFPSRSFVPEGSDVDLASIDKNEAWAITFPELKRKRPDLRLVPAGDMMELALAGPLKYGRDIHEVLYEALVFMSLRNADPAIRANAYKALGDVGKNVVDRAEVEFDADPLPEGLEADAGKPVHDRGIVDDDTLVAIAARISANPGVMEALRQLESYPDDDI